MVAEDNLVPFLLKAPLIFWSKFSEYVGCKVSRAVIMTSLATFKRLLGDAAFVWDPPTPKKLAQIIENLYKDAELRRTIGEAGKSLVEQRYLWEFEQKKILKSYNALLIINKKK